MNSRSTELWKEFLEILDKKEISDNGTEFSPTTITSCRVMDSQKLENIFKEVKELIKK